MHHRIGRRRPADSGTTGSEPVVPNSSAMSAPAGGFSVLLDDDWQLFVEALRDNFRTPSTMT